MDDILDNNIEEEGSQPLSDKEIFTKIWTSPRIVLRNIHEHNYDKHVRLLIMLGGINRLFAQAVEKNWGDTMPLWGVIATCVIAGSLLGWIGYYIFSGLTSLTGKWLGGKGNTDTLVRIYAYATIPAILSLCVRTLQIILYGNGLFLSVGYFRADDALATPLAYGAYGIYLLLGIYTLVFYVAGIAEVQKFSIGRSIANLLLAAFVIVIPIIVLVLLIWI